MTDWSEICKQWDFLKYNFFLKMSGEQLISGITL